MLEQIYTLLQQIFIMFLMMSVGFVLDKRDFFDEHTTKKLSKLLAQIIMPAVIIASFQRSFDAALAKTLMIMIVFAFFSLVLSIVIAQLLYRSEKYDNCGSRRMCAIFSNDAFMAFPLLEAMFGANGIFLGSAHIVANTVMIWTYGVRQLSTDRKSLNLRSIFLNPGVIAVVAGLALFISPVKLPDTLFSVLQTIGSLNTPLAMLILGSYVANAQILHALRSLDTWKISFVRLLLIPLILMVPLLLLPIDVTAGTILLIGIATPIGVMVATFAQIFDSDYIYSTRAIALSTLLSAITLPAMVALFQMLKAI